MEEVVHDDGWRVEGSSHAVVVADVRKSFLGGKRARLFIQSRPVGSVFVQVYRLVGRHELGVAFAHVPEDVRLVRPAKVQILQPDEVAVVANATDDGCNIGDAREDQ